MNDWQSFVDVLAGRAAATPDRVACRFLTDGEPARELTYGELDTAARAVAATLQQQPCAGERAVLLFPPGLDYVTAYFGCLYAGVIAVPAYPPMGPRQVPRLSALLADAEPGMILTTESTVDYGRQLLDTFGDAGRAGAARWLATDTVETAAAGDWSPPGVDGATTAFLQYTSGTTGRPKGVVVSHANLLHNSRLIRERFGHDTDSSGVIWLPPYHDMGLIGGILQPVYAGFPVTLMSPLSFLRDPGMWLGVVSRYAATTSGGPNFAFDLCVRKIPAEVRAGLDLSAWRVAFVGSETIRPATLRAFTEAFAPHGFRPEAFYPCYGLAEATLMVTGGGLDRAPTVAGFDTSALTQGVARPAGTAPAGTARLVGCGYPAADHDLLIVDPVGQRPLPDGTVGEVWVRGPSVSSGYWQRPGQAAGTAPEHLGRLPGGGDPFLRTGDLAFLWRGELFVTGRMKDVVVIRGRNYAPDAIELAASGADRRLRPGCGAAFGVDSADGGRLTVAHEVAAGDLDAAAAADLARAVRAAVTEVHGLAVHTVALLRQGTLPKTSSGKVQRGACRDGLLDGTIRPLFTDDLSTDLPDDPPADDPPADDPPADDPPADDPPADDPATDDRATDVGERLDAVRTAAARVLGVDPADVTADRLLTDFGLDSVKAVELSAVLARDDRLHVPLERLLSGATAADLATSATPLPAEEITAAPTGGDPDGTALTDNERAMWFLQQLSPDSHAYHLCEAVDITGPIAGADLRRVLDAVTARHPALRTRFAIADGEPVRTVAAASVELTTVDATGWDDPRVDADLAAFAAQPIDLLDGPLWRLRHLVAGPDRHVLALATHHIVADLWSLATLVRELVAGLAGEPAPRPAAADPGMALVAGLERAYLDSAAARSDADRWADRLADAPPATELATDRPRPAVQTYHGAAHRFVFPAPTAGAVLARAREWAVTPYAVLLASFSWLLHRYTGAEDLVVGAPAPGRTDAATHDVVGMLVNTVPVRCEVRATQTFRDAVAGSAVAVTESLTGQRFPMARLVEQLQPQRDPSRSPLFQIVLALQQAPGRDDLAAFVLGEGRLSAGPLRISPRRVPPASAPFELTVEVVAHAGGLRCQIRYNRDLWDAQTVELLAEHWQRLLTQACAEPTVRAGDVELLSGEDRRRLLTELNAARVAVPVRPLHAGLREWADRTPDATALVDGAVRYTYRELDDVVSRQVARLRHAGVGLESRVGVLIGRSASFVVAALAVLRAGGVYVPLDPEQPAGRLTAMVRGADLALLLTDGTAGLAAALDPQLPPTLELRDAPDDDTPPDRTAYPVAPANAAYIMHTSGTTGAPKGVCCTHAGARNLLEDFHARARIRPGDVCAWWTSTGFDVSVYEIFEAIDAGGQLVVVPDRVRLDPGLFADWLAEERVAAGYVPPFAVEAVTDRAERSKVIGVPLQLRRLMVGVEPIAHRTLARLAAATPELRILNAYGPTETTIIATVFGVAALHTDAGMTPLGRPIDNGPVYLLDGQQRPVPIGAAGEVHIGGTGVARGYYGQPALTADRFRPDPWEPGGRMYRTGDVARYGRDGQLRFLGRRDTQVKLRGVRIELLEVEAALQLDERVQSAVAVLRDVDGQPVIVGYVVAGDAPPSPQEVLARARQVLPVSMLPSAVMCLPAWPLTRNGKLDRAALPAPRFDPVAYEEPLGPLETTIAAVWSQLLGGVQIGRRDDFFGLGGHSLLAARGALELGRRLDRDVPLAAMFTNPTVAALAEALAGTAPDSPIIALPRGGDYADLCAQVAALPDYAVAGLLGDPEVEST